MSRDWQVARAQERISDLVQRSVCPGKQTLTELLPSTGTAGESVQLARISGHANTAVQLSHDGSSQGDAPRSGLPGPAQAVATAHHGVSGPGQAMPHGSTIQRLFGRHDVSGISAHVGGIAADAASSLGATAYATGNSVAFQQAPDLHTAAHEATHVVQQRAGVSFKGVGQAGDRYEQHADAVADAVVAGHSAEPILDQMAGGGSAGAAPGGAVQRMLEGKAPEAPAGAAPAKTPVADLAIHADTETADRTVLTNAELKDARVGHSWITLKYKDVSKVPATVGSPTKSLLKAGGTAMGFWPLIRRASDWRVDGKAADASRRGRISRGETPGAGASNNAAHTGFSLNPFKSVPGRVEEPDDAHAAKGSKQYELTQPEVDKLLTYANGVRNRSYNLYTYNCTTFAVEAVNATGHVAPSGTMFGGVALPNSLYKDILQMKVDGDASATTTPVEPGETETTPSPSKKK